MAQFTQFTQKQDQTLERIEQMEEQSKYLIDKQMSSMDKVDLIDQEN